MIRMPEQDYPYRVGLTEEAQRTLRRQKKIQKKSMSRIVCDLLSAVYGINDNDNI